MKIRILFAFIASFAAQFDYAQELMTVRIHHGNEISNVNFSDSILTLKRDTFYIEFSVLEYEGMFVQASFKDDFFKIPQKKELPDFEMTAFKVMSEEENNVDQDLIVAEDGFCYWFSDTTKGWYRTDIPITMIEGGFNARYTVRQVYNRETDTYTPLGELTEPLYLIFFLAKVNHDSHLTKEVVRKKICLKFE